MEQRIAKELSKKIMKIFLNFIQLEQQLRSDKDINKFKLDV
jgi:hypothetical protein